MAYIHCCSGLRKCRSFILQPEDSYVYSKMLYLEKCPVCEHTRVQLLRVNYKCEISSFSKSNEKARKLFEKLKNSVLFEEKIKFVINAPSSNFYLGYSEFGVKKKCYSNISTLKIGLFDPEEGLRELLLKKDFVRN